MKHRAIWLLTGLLLSVTTKGQELYIHSEPASNIPKGVIGVRAISEIYQEGQQARTMNALRIMYGISPKLMVWVQPNISNHHDNVLPDNLVATDGGQPHSHNVLTGNSYPYTFNGFHFYSKFLFLKNDKANEHFRMAVYAEGSTNFSAHDEAEPRLVDDNAGVGGGLIATELYKKLAVSLTAGYIKGFPYKEKETSIEFRYGDGLKYSISLGYLLLPFKYKNYDQTNVNVYAEFLGKAYTGATILKDGQAVEITPESVALQAGHYIEFHPGIQFIIKSNTRVDLSAGFRFVNRSYIHTYPLYNIRLQHYFYLGKG